MDKKWLRYLTIWLIVCSALTVLGSGVMSFVMMDFVTMWDNIPFRFASSLVYLAAAMTIIGVAEIRRMP